MEFLIFIALVIIIVLLVKLRSLQQDTAAQSQQQFQALKKELLLLNEAGIKSQTEPITLQPTDEKVVQWRPYIPPVIIEKDLAINETKTAPEATEELKEVISTEEIIIATTIKPIEEPTTLKHFPPASTSESWWQKWLQNNPDLEKFVGENLVNKIGIAVLVLGIAFFVKYAIDQDWINETGRVIIGIGCGAILIGIAHYLRNSYRAFSSVLAGGGIAVFYFTIAFAFHEYHIFTQTASFIIMLFITAFAVALSLLYNKIELAVIAVVGGFLAPFLVSEGSGNYIVLFNYLIILNVGMLTMSYFKKWSLLHLLSFVFTLLIFAGWLFYTTDSGNNLFPYKNGLLFATVFYLLFLTTVLIHNLRTQKPFKAVDFSLLMAVTFSYFTEGIIILSNWNNGAYQGVFTALLGLINLGLAWYLFKSQRGDKNLLYLLIGLTLTFISLAAPIQLHGHTITMFWSAECVLLYWLHQRSSIKIFKYSSIIVLILMLISLQIDWFNANEKTNAYLTVIFYNWQGGITNIITIVSLWMYAILLRKDSASANYILFIKNPVASFILAIISFLVLYITCIYGINLGFISQQRFDIPNAYHQLITYAFIALILIAFKKLNVLQNPVCSIIAAIVAFLFFVVSSKFSGNLINGIVENKYDNIHAIAYWMAIAAMLFLLYQLIQVFRANIATLSNKFAWLINLMLLIFFSVICKNIYVSLLANSNSYYLYTTQYLKAGLTIVWASYSFIIMWLGMRKAYKTLRIISLSIFSIALFKLFLLDISNISEGGKIAAFIMLGVLLLVISFMYQRLKKIIIDNEEKNS